MSMLSGPEILRQMQLGNIVIDPFDKRLLNPNSVNLRMGDELLIYKLPPKPLRTGGEIGEYDYLDMKIEPEIERFKIPPEGVVLIPNQLYIGHTLEYTETRGFVPCIEGRSSVARLGMCVHITAGFGDEGFCGQWTTEITVVHALRVYAGVPICQISYATLEGEHLSYRGKYLGNRGPHPSRLWKDFLPGGSCSPIADTDSARSDSADSSPPSQPLPPAPSSSADDPTR